MFVTTKNLNPAGKAHGGFLPIISSNNDTYRFTKMGNNFQTKIATRCSERQYLEFLEFFFCNRFSDKF